jgi:D-cysteine desulfhydrase family pyridoxal phosphate-dependent enzyme
MKTIPRLKFAHLPTPIEALPRVSSFLGGPKLYVKRDDMTGLALGGNKTRKLEFLLAEAQANGARTVITAGAAQSNHCRQTAAAAARTGFECILVLSGEPSELEEGNLLLDKLLGAEIVWTSRSDRDRDLKKTFNIAWQKGRRPYLIPYGGSNPTGAAAYYYAFLEMMEQALDSPLKGHPDWIVFPSSSGGTQAGMVLGAKLSGFQGNVLGISIDEPVASLQEKVSELVRGTAEMLGVEVDIQTNEVLVNADYLGGGYGVMGDPERDAIHLFARMEGLILDPVYTGRAAAGLVDLIRKGHFKADQTILFWYTGGAPALFTEKYQDII